MSKSIWKSEEIGIKKLEKAVEVFHCKIYTIESVSGIDKEKIVC